MLNDNIKNAKKYYNLSKGMELGLRYLESTDFSTISNGRYEISGKDVYAIVQNYMTKDESEAKFEAHKKYIDIQYIALGEEKIGVSDISDFEIEIPYSEEKDIMFLKSKNEAHPIFIELKPTNFIILTPSDAHLPSIKIKEPKPVKKVVVKVRV